MQTILLIFLQVTMKDAYIMEPSKYLSNILGTLEMPLINCGINLFLTWYAKSFVAVGTVVNQVPTFAITDTKLYVPIVTLWTQGDAKLI